MNCFPDKIKKLSISHPNIEINYANKFSFHENDRKIYVSGLMIKDFQTSTDLILNFECYRQGLSLLNDSIITSFENYGVNSKNESIAIFNKKTSFFFIL